MATSQNERQEKALSPPAKEANLPTDSEADSYISEDDRILGSVDSSLRARDTDSFPNVRNTNYLCIPFEKVYPGQGTINVEVRLSGGDSAYNPCNSDDPYHESCKSNSYYLIRRYNRDGTSGFARGILIGNDSTLPNRRVLSHGWANRLYKVCVEIYPDERSAPIPEQIGQCRFEVLGSEFIYPHPNGGLRCRELGRIQLPQSRYIGDGDLPDGSYRVARVNGYIRSRRPIQPDTVSWQLFGGNSVTSNGRELNCMRSFSNESRNGYYDSGAIYPGRYFCDIKHNINGEIVRQKQIHLSFNRDYERVDIDLDDDDWWGSPRPDRS